MMIYETIETMGKMEANRKTPIKAWRNSPGNFDAARYYANKHNKPIAIIPGNSYGSMVYHIAAITADFAKFRPGCMDGIGAVVSPNNDTVNKVRFVS